MYFTKSLAITLLLTATTNGQQQVPSWNDFQYDPQSPPTGGSDPPPAQPPVVVPDNYQTEKNWKQKKNGQFTDEEHAAVRLHEPKMQTK